MTINTAIDESLFAFGLDGSKYWSSNGLADFKILAQAQNPTVRFLAFRAVISWGYIDSFFAYHWKETKRIYEYRKAFITGAPDDFYLPVGCCAYGVIYPGENAKRQAENLLKAVEDTGDVDWTHDRLVIDLELHHNQSPQRITETTNLYGETLKKETGRLPMLYTRYFWSRDHTIYDQLLDFDWWYAQYLRDIPGIRYRKEYPPPPKPTHPKGWKVHQNSKRGRPQPYGVIGKSVVDYDRWNGGKESVFEYFSFEKESAQPTMTVKERLDDHEKRIKLLEESCM